MYTVINVPSGKLIVNNEIISDIESLLNVAVPSLRKQETEIDLLCWLHNIFTPSFSDQHGSYCQNSLEKTALIAVNSMQHLIIDKDAFVTQFNNNNFDFYLSYIGATFTPDDDRAWYDTNEFIFLDQKQIH
ncbi:hypothetical protein [Pseudoalteromonas sp. S554]|uniref:hypothetical protein n=1 Tax=Pseudoalteromonas sp. S554 TaxID=2066516 RepID=UPI00110CE74A|nr:hypothetical protein [Pseudoalteromonas sp. S554]TMS80567.1 hypothetical protein CWB65_14715 [Pseudoalteromonas sp. S554]